MRLTLKLTLAYLLAVAAVIALQGYVRFQLGVTSHALDEDRDHARVATALARLVSQTWELDGASHALEALSEAEAAETGLRIRFGCETPVDSLDDAPPCSELLARPITRVVTGQVLDDGTQRRATLEPVLVRGHAVGVLEVSEPVATEQAWRRDAIARLSFFGMIIVVATSLMALLTGLWLVARPTAILVEKARAVGRGDLSPALVLRTGDEFSLLADAMNTMCDRIAEARARAAGDAEGRTRAIEQLRHAERLATVGTLASGVAHELGTPLSVIEARAELLASCTHLTEREKKHVAAIADASERMTRIVRQLLLFAREDTLAMVPLDAHKTLLDAVAFVAPIAGARGVNLSIAERSTKSRFEGDPVLVQQALVNVLMNAIQASPSGATVHGDVSDDALSFSSSFPRPPSLSMTISDEGPGIDDEHRARIFEPFFTTKAPGEGTGLGLSVVHAIVSEHRGSIDVASERGVGSTFTLRFPRLP